MSANAVHKQKIAPDSQEALGLKAQVISGSDSGARSLARELQASLRGWLELEIVPEGDADVLFVDSDTPEVETRIAAIDRTQGKSVFLVVREDDEVPPQLVEGAVDDVIVHPFRSLEVLGRLRQHQKNQAHREASELNASYAQLVDMLQMDLKLAERLQKQRLPRRFPEVRGFKVTSRYLAGDRSGGDYVDMAETRDGQNLVLVMTDASSYRLSSAVLDTISRRLSSLPQEETRSCVTAARRIRDGVLISMNERDHLSLFYGVLSRKDYRLRYLNLGGTRVFYAPPGGPFAEAVDGQADPIIRATSVRTEHEGELVLEPEGRLALISDGFIESAGGLKELLKVLDRHRSSEAADTVNELVFRTKKSLSGPDELPVQDCTAVLFDVDSRLIRLA